MTIMHLISSINFLLAIAKHAKLEVVSYVYFQKLTEEHYRTP